MRISRMPPWRHPAAAQQIARRTPQINAGVVVGENLPTSARMESYIRGPDRIGSIIAPLEGGEAYIGGA